MGYKLENISFSFGEKVIFEDFSYEFPDRGIVCLMGPSGRGKTTLLRLMAGLLKPDSGTVLGPERPAVMFQEDRLLPWVTMLENVAAVCNDRARAVELLEAVGLGEELDSLPESLSGGMRRRGALARTLAFGGDALLLDEPFKGLDGDLRGRMRQLILDRGKDCLTLLVTHDEEDVHALGAAVLRL